MLYKWIGKDGGWKVGKELEIDGFLVTREEQGSWGSTIQLTAMQHSHTGELEWVEPARLVPYLSRSERGEEPYGSDTVKREPVDSIS